MEVHRDVDDILNDINPLKSKQRYEDRWKQFRVYTGSQDMPTEYDFIQYFDYLKRVEAKSYSTLWTIYSMLNYKHQALYGKKLQMYPRITVLLKSYESGYNRKAAQAFTSVEIESFLTTAPNEGEYLHIKVAVAIGYSGGLRLTDLVNLQWSDLECKAITGYWVNYKVSKQKQEVWNRFNIPQNYSVYIDNYFNVLKSFSVSDGRVFKCMRKNKLGLYYYTVQPMGEHSIAQFTKKIAVFLKLEKPDLYTSHSLKRSSATTVAEAGASAAELKKHYNWKSESTAMKYIASTDSNKLKISGMISGESDRNVQTTSNSCLVDPLPDIDLLDINLLDIESSMQKVEEKKQKSTKVIYMVNCSNVNIN